jgi:hypothetical protein
VLKDKSNVTRSPKRVESVPDTTDVAGRDRETSPEETRIQRLFPSSGSLKTITRMDAKPGTPLTVVRSHL